MTKAQLDEWWSHTEFWEMEQITGYKQDDFDPEDGYQDFVDACDEWWEKQSYSNKIYLYNQFGV
jgi:hypothetical protein